MNRRYIGVALIVIGVIMAGMVYYMRTTDQVTVAAFAAKTGSCYVNDETCLHDQANVRSTVGWVFSAALVVIGLILMLMAKTDRLIAEQHVKVSSALENAAITEKTKDELKAFLAGFSPDEQKVLRAIREQDGIMQSTLRFLTGMSKSTLSLMLTQFEKKGLISREESGKTNKIHWRKVF